MNRSRLPQQPVISGAVVALLLVLAGCASAPPPAPRSELRQQAARRDNDGQRAYRDRNWSSAAAHFQRAAEIHAALDDDAAVAASLHNRAQSLRQSGRADEARAGYEQARQLNQTLGRPARQAENLAGLAWCHAAHGDLDGAIQTLETALDLAVAGENEPVQAVIRNDLGLLLLQRGDSADQARVIELFESALAAGQAGDSPARIATAHLNLGRAGIEFGDLDTAGPHLLTALETFRSVDDPVGLAHTQEILGLLHLRRGEPDTARRWFQRARAKYAFLRDEAGLRRVDAVQP